MNKIVSKISASFNSIGIPRTIYKLTEHSFRVLYRRVIRKQTIEEKVSRFQNIEDRFTEIYRNNYWGNFESVSGNGSTLEASQNLRRQLPGLVEKFSIQTIFDAPCGDFHWMREALKNIQVNYIGGDIVRALVDAHNSNYKNAKTTFIHMDITKDSFPASDLMICRDCLFHLAYKDTKLALQNFIDSGIPYLLTTTYVNNGAFSNQDIVTGSFRLIDLFSAPYNFPKDVLYRIDDTIPRETSREMCLWSRDQIISAMEKFQ
ncbi:class I SAM-dependent methyltransferase [Sideroxydans sp. CL21]|uniref:class I SAM-dependent methyltransferase n=1 Tax=Sideroxydans sp. CL21 TaxID=2600596 RepID=UPI0024BD3045|nr:class I SAM-dependent methyltransferase [Sideroxydans sp. CL21]